MRLALIIGLACLIAQAARHWRRQVQPLLPDSQAAAGVAVLGLMVVGLAMTSGIRAHWASGEHAFMTFVAVAIAINLGVGLLGALLFRSWGAKDALTIGMVSGNRNVTLAWAAAGATLPAATEAYVAACVLPVLSTATGDQRNARGHSADQGLETAACACTCHKSADVRGGPALSAPRPLRSTLT